MGLFVLILLGAIAILAFVVILGAIIIGIYWVVSVLNRPTARSLKEKQLRLAAEGAEQQKKLVYEAEQQKKLVYDAQQARVWQLVVNCISGSEASVQQICEDIAHAEKDIQDAEREFAERAFAPFWDAVERAANRLVSADSNILQVSGYSQDYGRYVAQLDSIPPAYRVGLNTLPNTAQITTRLGVVVRVAQKDFQFSTIFEQRKTNKLLKGGFSNLAEALNQVGQRLESSMGVLADSISTLAETSRANTDELIPYIEHIRETMASDASARREHEEAQREMLDNLQRKRKPRDS